MRIGAAAGADADFRRLWTGAAISQLGSAVGMVALPVVAVAVVRASAFQVSLLAAVSAVTTVLVSLPVGAYVEFRRKRPVLIGSDLVRCGSLLSIPCAAAFGSLTFAQLCVVAALNAVGQIAFVAASQANLAGLVTREDLVDANSRLQSTNWLSLSAGPSIGGALIGFLGAAGTLAVDALSFLGSALAVVRIRAGEPAPPRRDTSGSRRREIALGLHFVVRDPVLRRMLLSWVIFAGAVGMAAPLSTVFYLRDLHFTPWQYGLIMGIPSLGGFAGARLVRRAAARSGAVRALWWASVLRGPWYFLIPLAMPGYPGLVTCVVGFTGVLFFAAMANATMTGCRQLLTPGHLMARVAALWSFTTTAAQPAFILSGGLLANWLGIRASLVVAAIVMSASAFLLPSHEPAGTVPG
ncbi:MAG: major Facilitator Superfamily protein [Actinomycetia bacterium]|nr:major Facilitator Superfamily protein [Actinomycetes bacterium]